MFIQILQQRIIHCITTIQQQLQVTQTFSFVAIFGLIVFFNCVCFIPEANAIEFGEVKYHDALIDYSKIDKDLAKQRGDSYFSQALQAKDETQKRKLLQKSAAEYFMLTQADPQDLYSLVQMARIYDYLGENSYAKAYFFRGLKINKQDPATNYYFGEFYYQREDYKRALFFYQRSFEYGYKENFDVIVKMAIMYEKLGDLLRANQYYKKAFLLKPNDDILPNKIRELESIKYKKSGYYSKTRKK